MKSRSNLEKIEQEANLQNMETINVLDEENRIKAKFEEVIDPNEKLESEQQNKCIMTSDAID